MSVISNTVGQGIVAHQHGSAADVDEHAGVVEGSDHAMARPGEAAIVRLPATRAKVIGDVVGELHDPHAEGDAAQAQRAAAVRRARALVERIQAAGCSAGVCIAPETSAEVIGGARHKDQP